MGRRGDQFRLAHAQRWDARATQQSTDEREQRPPHLAIVEADDDLVRAELPRPAQQPLGVVHGRHADEAAAGKVHDELVRRRELGLGAGVVEVDRDGFAAGSEARPDRLVSDFELCRRTMYDHTHGEHRARNESETHLYRLPFGLARNTLRWIVTGGRWTLVANLMYGLLCFSHVMRSISTVQKARNLRSCEGGDGAAS